MAALGVFEVKDNRVYYRAEENDADTYNVGWVLDERVQKCMRCEASFGLFLRKHHCRSCGDVVCHPCSERTMKLQQLDSHERVCELCFVKLRESSKSDEVCCTAVSRLLRTDVLIAVAGRTRVARSRRGRIICPEHI
jgi:hypothetical protein